MAVIVDQLKLIYFLAPGTGSTAVADFLLNNYQGENIPNNDVKSSEGNLLLNGKHSTFPELKKANLLDVHQIQYLKITGVRNPYDFFYAEWYRHRTRWIKEVRNKSSWVFTNEKKLQEIVDCVTMDFSEWVINKLRHNYETKRQVMLHIEYLDNADMFVRMEYINKDMSKIISKCLGKLEEKVTINVPKINVTDRDREYWRYYSREARQILEFVYQPYIKKFNYCF